MTSRFALARQLVGLLVRFEGIMCEAVMFSFQRRVFRQITPIDRRSYSVYQCTGRLKHSREAVGLSPLYSLSFPRFSLAPHSLSLYLSLSHTPSPFAFLFLPKFSFTRASSAALHPRRPKQFVQHICGHSPTVCRLFMYQLQFSSKTGTYKMYLYIAVWNV